MVTDAEARPRIPRSFIAWAVVALVGSIIVLFIWGDLYTRLVAFLIFLVLWTVAWRIAVGIRQSEAELRAKR